MDFMKTLLVYMTATFALAVQNTAAPSVTPIPQATPSAVVVETIDPNPTMRIIQGVTPAPGETITPAPVPQITPNRSYHNLKMGSKGKDVRKLQERLVELGYLPEGSADGSYGRQTFNAVRRFQYYNGLTDDGIAGDRTQTYLFENPDAAANPENKPTPAPTPETTPETTPEPTPEPTAAPTPEPTAEPTPEPTAEPTPAPTAEPTPEPTAEPTPEPTAEPEIPEIVLDGDLYVGIDGFVAYNDSGAPLDWVVVVDGIPVSMTPRLQENNGRIRISLADLVSCLEGWKLTEEDGGAVVLEAEGHTLSLRPEGTGCAATLDGTEIPAEDAAFDFENEGCFISVEFLARALGGEAVWDAEEITLMLRIPAAAPEAKD